MAAVPSLRNFFKSLSAVKVKEVPTFLKNTVTVENVSTNSRLILADYKKKYIDTGSAMPLFHLIGGVGALAYVVAWPQEYKHWQHEQEMKHKGGKH